MIRFRGAAALILAASAASPVGAVTLAERGKARAVIVVPRDPIPAETTAAEELAGYLEAVTGARFAIAKDGDPRPAGAAIFVGPTDLAMRVGLGPGRSGPEAWGILSEGRALVLAGGRPRGTLYAVYRFLEDVVGVRWWTPFDTTIPARRTLRVSAMDRRGTPAFGYRAIHGLDGGGEFRVHLRLNGGEPTIPPSFGASEAVGGPGYAHTFFRYLPPDVYFDAHPDWYSLRGGFRSGGRSQLCLTNPQLLDRLAEAIGRLADADAARARVGGTTPPRMYDLSQNDWGGACGCDACRRLVDRHGSEAGPLIVFVNAVAERLAVARSGLALTTLAYTYTFNPPSDLSARDDVIVRVSGWGKRDFSAGADDPRNARYREALSGWCSVARHVWVWDYGVQFDGSERGMPLPTWRHLADDMRFYRARGVEGLFVQHDFPIAADLHDLKVWMLAHLMEDPDRDADALLAEFLNGFYGPAASLVREYLGTLEDALDRRPSVIAGDAGPGAFAFVDDAFLGEAHRIFDRAEAAVTGNPVLERRVRHARLSLDYATLVLGRAGAPVPGPRKPGRPASLPNAGTLVERYRRTWREEVELRLTATERAPALADLESEIERWTAN